MIWNYATFLLLLLCLLLSVLVFQTRKRLDYIASKNKKFSSVQRTFSKAVEGVEASLEQEKQNSSRFVKTLETIQDGVAIMDVQGNLQYANSSLWRLYAIPFEDRNKYLKKSWLKLHSPKGQEEIKAIVQPALERKNSWFGETDVLVWDGSMIRAELHISKSEDGFIGFIRDVTDRHKAELDRENLQTQIHQLQKFDAVERVVRALVHEFSNSLSSIGGFSEMLTEDLPEESLQKDYADKIYHASQQMQGLIEQARLLIPGGRTEDVQTTNAIEIVPIVIGELKKRLSQDFEIQQSFFIDEAKIKCDPFRLNQILFHILQNAIESQVNASAGISVEIDMYRHGFDNIVSTKGKIFHQIEKLDDNEIRLHYGVYDPAFDYIQITVSDCGRGIPRDVMEHVLDPFFSTKKQKDQSGLGMSIVRSVMRHCEGYLVIRSRLGKGTNVTVILPAFGFVNSDSRSTKAVIQQLVQEMT